MDGCAHGGMKEVASKTEFSSHLPLWKESLKTTGERERGKKRWVWELRRWGNEGYRQGLCRRKHWIVELFYFLLQNINTPLPLALATKVDGWLQVVVVVVEERQMTAETHTLLRQAITAGAGTSSWGPALPDTDVASQVSKREGRKWWREGGKRIGMRYTTHDKHIHPHYCNNPLATHQRSHSLPHLCLAPFFYLTLVSLHKQLEFKFYLIPLHIFCYKPSNLQTADQKPLLGVI